MCQSKAEGGHRCAGHTRPKYHKSRDRVLDNSVPLTEETLASLREATEDYATTAEGLRAIPDDFPAYLGLPDNVTVMLAVQDGYRAGLAQREKLDDLNRLVRKVKEDRAQAEADRLAARILEVERLREGPMASAEEDKSVKNSKTKQNRRRFLAQKRAAMKLMPDAPEGEVLEIANLSPKDFERWQRLSMQQAEVRALYPEASEGQIDALSGLKENEYKIWKKLQEAGPCGMCRECLREFSGVTVSTNGATEYRGLRQSAGIAIDWERVSGKCDTHPGTVTWDTMPDPLPKIEDIQIRAVYGKRGFAKVRKALGNKDAFTGSTITNGQVDHRSPRWVGAEPHVDVDDPVAIRNRYMTLSPENNTRKREACGSCKATGKRPAFNGVKHWFDGGEDYSASVGCSGCGWAHPERWRSTLNTITTSVQEVVSDKD